MIWTALILGFAGSLHCLGMCSPLMMVVTNISGKGFLKRIVYNSGRIASYAVLGATFSAVGGILPSGFYQNTLSVVMGTILLIVAFAGIFRFERQRNISVIPKFQAFLRKLFSKYIGQKNFLSSFILGTLNGLLPCGLTSIALSVCVTLDGAVSGLLFMCLFGIGTLPVMLGLVSILHTAFKRYPLNPRAVTTTLLIVSGLLLVYRGAFLNVSEPHSSSAEASSISICK